MLSFHVSINVIIIVVSFKILDLCPIALFQQLWNTLYIYQLVCAPLWYYFLVQCAVPKCGSIQHPRDAGERGHDGSSSSCPFKRGSGDGNFIRSTWNEFIAVFCTSIKCRMVFYNICHYFWCQHFCWTETSIIGNIFFKFSLPSSHLLPPPALPPFQRPWNILSVHIHLLWTGAELGGCQGWPLPPQNFAWPPQNFPRDVMSLHWSPTQTIDSSPCCKTGPSSGPPNENVWLRPWLWTTTFWSIKQISGSPLELLKA